MYRSHNKPVLDLGVYQEVVGITLGCAIVEGVAEVDFEPYKVRLPLEALSGLEDSRLSPGNLISILSTESGVRIRCLSAAKDQGRVILDHLESRRTKRRPRIQRANGQEQIPNQQPMIRAPKR